MGTRGAVSFRGERLGVVSIGRFPSHVPQGSGPRVEPHFDGKISNAESADDPMTSHQYSHSHGERLNASLATFAASSAFLVRVENDFLRENFELILGCLPVGVDHEVETACSASRWN